MASTPINSGTTILLFGPQALSFSEESLRALRTALTTSKSCQWILDTVSDLGVHWDNLSTRFRKLREIPGKKLLNDLHCWLETGVIDQSTLQLPNIILTPIVVIVQLLQYSRYIQNGSSVLSECPEDSYAAFTKRNVEIVGFCTGLLSASVVSSSSDQATFQHYGAVAVRLAMLIGAVVDAQDASDRLHGRSKSFATAWSSPAMAKEMVRVLDCFPESYISVLYDENRATVTTSEGAAPLLLQQLRQAGVTASGVGLRGRFHCQCHHDDLNEIIDFCDMDPALQFPDISAVALPLHLKPPGEVPDGTKLHHAVLRMILEEQSTWYSTFLFVQTSRLGPKDSVVVSFGPDRGVPSSLMRRLGPRLVQAADLDQGAPRLSDSVLDPSVASINQGSGSDDDIAIVSMACQVAGADDLEEFWKIICEGKSQHVEVPEERFGFETQFRNVDPKKKWFGNFVKDHDVFDHKFFKKSPREIVSTDPQHRLMLQCAYQAVEQSGYFHQPKASKNIGCYLGACAADYEHNVAGYEPNAFTATGNLKSFIAGKISHYFGWTGPALTIDTACSASAVAIHQACRAIADGECSGAIAGGAAIMGNPIWFQNLAGASFLSPTGACKPWDDKADGYCRGEAIAFVFLKKMSTAIADGNQILGCIASTAVSQNENCTPVFVPNSPSLSSLFKDVIRKARLEPHHISVVEAHGTGTPVGDPVEYESVRQALGGPIRDSPLQLGSVKGLVGHTEGASGVVSLIKAILMIQEGAIPPQASFQTLSRHILASPSDMIEIATKLQPWTSNFKAALINNYGASGSNASMVVTQPLQAVPDDISQSQFHASDIKHPFWICGLDDRSLRAYCTKLLRLINSRTVSAKKISAANLSFNICRQSNRALDRGLMFSSSSIEGVKDKLMSFVNGDPNVKSINVQKTPLPVIMCFGGQISTFVGLDRKVYDGVKILRSYLDQCNSVLLSIGLAGIYPGIFQREPIDDTVKLQTMLFAIQYACAKSWIECGIKVATVIGHSFGELTALCVSGVLSLKDTVKMIAGRAELVNSSWGPDRGSMIAIEADLELVHRIITEAGLGENSVTIACFNGPRNFTLAGSTRAIEDVKQLVASNSLYLTSIRTKELNVTNAFHSNLVEPLVEGLEQIGNELTFREATIPLERSTEYPCTDEMTETFVAEHMRNPVYFNHAVQRLARQHPSAIWLEAGSNSTITAMAKRALGSPSSSQFQSVNITSDNGLQSFTDTILTLWGAGLKVEYWPHHALQTHEYPHIFLPPYQFEKLRHWLELKKPARKATEPETSTSAPGKELPTGLWTFVGYQDENKRSARFRVNTMTKEYEEFIYGHLVAQTAPICPATLEVDMAIEALMSIRPDFASAGLQPTLQNMKNHAAICMDPSRLVWLDYEALDAQCHSWSWKIFSHKLQKSDANTEHVSGKLIFRSMHDPEYHLEFARYERFVDHQRCLDVLNSDEANDVIQGRNIYRTFAEIVDYGEKYRGLKRLVGLGKECAGRIVKKYTGKTWLDTYLTDCFSQVGGIWVNCMTDRQPQDMYIASGCETLVRSPKLRNDSPRPEVWDVFARHHQTFETAYMTDVFTFDAATGTLMEVMLGINYARVPKASMQRILNRLSPGWAPQVSNGPDSSRTSAASAEPLTVVAPMKSATAGVKGKKKTDFSRPDFKLIVKSILSNVSGVEPEDIQDNTELADIGIDSLMSMELAREVETIFKCTLSTEKLMEVTDLPSFVDCIQSCLPPNEDNPAENEPGHDDDSVDRDGSISPSCDGTSTPLSSVGKLSKSRVDIVEYLVELLGVSPSDIRNETLLVDLGVDSLLSTEVRSELAGKFQVHIPEDVSVEAMTVEELNLKINGSSSGKKNPTSSPRLRLASTVPTKIDETSFTNDTSTTPPAPFTSNYTSRSVGRNLELPASKVLEAFGEAKSRSDQLILDYKIDNFADVIYPKSTQLSIAITLEAFEELGCSIKSAKPGQLLHRIQYIPQHQKLVDYLYGLLEKEARLIDINDSRITRTAFSPPSKSSTALLNDLLRLYPDWSYAMKLTHFAGSRLTDVLTGKTDGIKVIFGSEEGKELVSGLYCDHIFNKMSYSQMTDFVERLISKLPMYEGPMRIMEMGAGTGGTTMFLAPLLARLSVPVEYNFTDLSPSMVAAARKKFKQYPFMKFFTHDIEKPVPIELKGTQHIVIASNAVHATHDLAKSSMNIRDALRPDGFLLMLEMTEIVPFVDIIFGLLEGWWLFEDGRKHAITHQDSWERVLQSSGFGHIDYSDGHLPENKIQKVIIALASGPVFDRLPKPDEPVLKNDPNNLVAREKDISAYIHRFSAGFQAPTVSFNSAPLGQNGKCVLITGTTGSVGSHLAKEFAERPDVETVVCLNRRSNSDPFTRQKQAFAARGITLDEGYLSKLKVLETDTSKSKLGLADTEYLTLVRTVTHILHNAWPMSGKRLIKGFETQFQVLRNLINLARDISCSRPQSSKVVFQFISSIGVVGYYPLWSGVTRVPEERMEVKSVLPNGYCDAKFTCERILDETLHKYPDRFSTMTARLGQVAGSSISGYWNPMEHFSFLVKSSKALRALPDFDGMLSWCPVNDMASALGDLLLSEVTPYPIYHIDNPTQQPWREMIATLADAMNVPIGNIIPFHEWVSKVRRSPLSIETDNPAGKLIDFLDGHFLRMSCGGLVLDTKKSCEHSKALSTVRPVSAEVARRYVRAWEEMGFLY